MQAFGFGDTAATGLRNTKMRKRSTDSDSESGLPSAPQPLPLKRYVGRLKL